MNAALQEDVQTIGRSVLPGARRAIVPRVMDLVREKQTDDVAAVIGAAIPREDAAGSNKMGVATAFAPGTPLDAIAEAVLASAMRAY